MCGSEGAEAPGGRAVLSRRALLAGTVAAAGSLVLGGRVPAAARRGPDAVDLGGVAVLPRDAWAAGLAPTGPIAPEPDVRYLLVHHSVDPGNAYGEADVAGILRSFFRFHTAPAKGWPDIAYNFLVDRFGRVWEGRAGSLAGPVAGDATGGNQGFDQLCCFVGNHQEAEPTADAFAAMAALLGVLARRHGIALDPGATATFTSRGSNRHPAGTVVTTVTIAGHREMSRTQCPGDRVVRRLPELRLLAAGGAPAPAAAPAATGPPPSGGAPVATTGPPPSPAPTGATTAPPGPAPTAAAAPVQAAAAPGRPAGGAPSPTGSTAAARDAGGDRIGTAAAVAGAAALAAAAATGAVAARRRPEPPGG